MRRFWSLICPIVRVLKTLIRVRSEFPEIPVIVLTGQEDEAIAIDAVKHGAQDYLFKGMVDGNLLVTLYVTP